MSAPTIVIIDNHDSFTFNVYQYFLIGGAHTHVVSADHVDDCQELIAAADGLVLSPGPGSPEQATASLSVLTRYFDEKPILGICLGHQVICHHMEGLFPTHLGLCTVKPQPLIRPARGCSIIFLHG